MKKRNEDDPDNLGGLGGMLPAEVLKMLNELLEQLHRADKEHQGSIVLNIYEKGSLHVDHVDTQVIASPWPPPKRGGNAEGREKGTGDLPEVLATDEAMVLWKKVQKAGYVDEHYQPLLSRTQAALLADAMAERLGIKEKWKVFEGLWNRKYMRSDYNLALSRKRSLVVQDELKRLFG